MPRALTSRVSAYTEACVPGICTRTNTFRGSRSSLRLSGWLSNICPFLRCEIDLGTTAAQMDLKTQLRLKTTCLSVKAPWFSEYALHWPDSRLHKSLLTN